MGERKESNAQFSLLPPLKRSVSRTRKASQLSIGTQAPPGLRKDTLASGLTDVTFFPGRNSLYPDSFRVPVSANGGTTSQSKTKENVILVDEEELDNLSTKSKTFQKWDLKKKLEKAKRRLRCIKIWLVILSLIFVVLVMLAPLLLK